MERVSNCAACIIAKRGIRTRYPVDHTCYKGAPDYKEPEFIIYEGGGLYKAGKYYKVFYHQCLFSTTRASKYTIKRGQIINGYKVPAGRDAWIPEHLHFDSGEKIQRFLWVHEEHYNEMAFV